METNGEVRLAVDAKDVLGEGVVWDADTSSVCWCDIEGKKFHQFFPSTGEVKHWDLPKRPGCFALTKRPSGNNHSGEEGDSKKAKVDDGSLPVLFAFEDGFALYDLESGKSEYLTGEHERLLPECRMNDGRVDHQGRLVAGGFNEKNAMEPGWKQACHVYRVGQDLVVRKLWDWKIHCANSTCFSPDGKTMYFCDSPYRTIWVFDYDAEVDGPESSPTFRSALSNIDVPGVPDGSTVDSEGGIWNAEYNNGRVRRYAPDGSVTNTIDLPVSRPSCVALGGPEMKTLYITTIKHTMSPEEVEKEPWVGGLLAVEVDVPGVPEPKFLLPETSTM